MEIILNMSDSESNLNSFFRNRSQRSEAQPTSEKLGPRAGAMSDMLSRAFSRRDQRQAEGNDAIKIPSEEDLMIGHASSLGESASELRKSIAEQRLVDLNREKSKESSDLTVLTEVVGSLVEKRSAMESDEAFPIHTLITTSPDIENSLVDLISTGDGDFSCDFKLTSEHFKLLETKVFSFMGSDVISRKDFTFKMIDGSQEPICEAYSIALDENTEILIAIGKKIDARSETLSLRAMEGYVSVRFKNEVVSAQTAIEQAFARLGLGSAILKSGEQVAFAQQRRQYEQHHKIDRESSGAISDLKTRELADGYVVTEEVGANESYIGANEFVLLHTSPIDNLAQVLKYGLISRMERYKRGIGQKNIPATPDMESGGADSVFVGCFSLDNENLKMLMPNSGVTFVFKSELLDRTDWYAYNSAKFGSTKAEDLAERPNPADFFTAQRENNILSNEIMLRRMISIDYIDAIIVKNEERRNLIAAMLKSNGITEVAGQPVDQILVTEEIFKNRAV